jgi:hypothetical protein
MSDEITTKLDQLADAQAYLDTLRLHYEQLEQSLIPPEVRQAIDSLNTERKLAYEAAQLGIDTLTAEIKTAVIAAGATVKGAHLQAVWTKGRVSWDTKALEGYAAGHPEVLPFRKEGEPSVTIRGVK